MADVLVMPQLGRITSEALLQKWLVEIGAEIRLGDPLCEIETDKATIEYESPFAGVLLRRVTAGKSYPVGVPIAIIGPRDESVENIDLFEPDPVNLESPIPASPETKGATTPPARKVQPAASPIARRLAKELGLDLATIRGTGPGNRITRGDIEAATRGSSKETLEVPSPMWKAVAESMSVSATIPQFALERDVQVTESQRIVDNLRQSQPGVGRPTIADAITVSLARALRDHQRFLRSWIKGRLVPSEEVNVGVAVALLNGLIVPVIHGADRLTILQASEQRNVLQQKAKAGNLSQADILGAVFTVSNLGPMGVHRFHPLINPPESGILGIGATTRRGDDLLLTLTLVADHRVVSGADGAALLSDIAGKLETPDGMQSLT